MDELGMEQTTSVGARLKYLALGSAACRILNHFFTTQTYVADLCLAIDTDLRCLEQLHPSLPKYCFAKKHFRGLSSGGDEALVKEVLGKEDACIQSFCQKTDVLIVLVGLSGGTGSGALLSTVQMALRAGAFVLIIPILPFTFEGKNKSIRARNQINALQSFADLVVPFYNDILFQTLPESATIKEAFQEGDKLITQMMCAFANSLNRIESGAFATNLNEFARHFSEKPDTVFWGLGKASGKNALNQALKKVFKCTPLKTHSSEAPAQRVFIALHSSNEIPLSDLKNLNYEIQSFLGVPEIQFLNSCHISLSDSQEVELFLLVSSTQKNIKTVRYRKGKQQASPTTHVQTQFDFEEQANESYWDTPTYLRMGLKLDT